MTEKQYFREKKVSSTSLGWFEKSPLYFKKKIDDEIIQIKQRYYELGQQVHMAVLEPIEFDKSYITLEYKTPTSKNQKDFCEVYMKSKDKVDAYKKSYKIDKKSDKKIEEESEKVFKELEAYITYLEKSKDYRDILSKTRWNLIHDLKAAALSHKKASELLIDDKEKEMNSKAEYFNEYVIFWNYPNGLECKSMLDRFIIDHENKVIKLVDFKTSFDVGGFEEHFVHFHYYRQLAFYWMAIYSEFKDKIEDFNDYKKETYIVAVQTKDLPECRTFSIAENLLDKGLEEIELIMKDLEWHFSENLWEHNKTYYAGDGSEEINETYER